MSALPRGIASAQVSRGSRTCIIVGSLDPVEDLDLSGFRSVLWFATRSTRMPERFRAHAERVRIATPAALDAGQLDRVVDDCIMQDSLFLPTVLLTEAAVGTEAPHFLPVLDSILTQCDGHRRARVTRQEAGFLWQGNLLGNLPVYARHRLPRAWAGALQGLPAFVCGAGPSLDVSAPALARVAAQGVVLAADSALSALSRLGVGVDFALSVDPVKTPEKCLPAGCTAPRRLVLSSVSPAAWRGAVREDQLCFVSSNQITEDWIARLGVAKTEFGVQGNCGITAVELAVYLGCGPIYLFGMDNAVNTRDGGRLHQQHYDAGQPLRAQYPKIPGNYDAEVEAPFLREWKTLDTRCAALPAGLVVNVIDRGARLRNTTLVHPTRLEVAPSDADAAERLARLAAPEAPGAGAWAAVTAAIRATVAQATPLIDAAAGASEQGDRAAAARALTMAYRDPVFRELMGNYSLKVMPHLLVADDTALETWRTIATETRRLLALAARVG